MEETGFAAYHRLLDEYWPESDGETRHRIEDEIWRRVGIETAVLVLDMSGFSRLTQQYGAVHYLSMVRRMNISMKDVIARNQGQLVKFEADNSFAIFPTVNDAIRCAIAANMQFQGMNLLTVERFDIRVCIGIAYGKILLVDGRDFFGEAVNTASRLGEDLAEPGEILVDAALEDALAAFRFDRIERDTPRGRVDALSIRY